MEAVLEHLAAMVEGGLITPETTVAELFMLKDHEKKIGLGTPAY